MQLISEDDQSELLRTKVVFNFQRQRGKKPNAIISADTIITWMDEETGIDFALSFQESKGAQETW